MDSTVSHTTIPRDGVVRKPLVVIGCGPTGIAALFQARRNGLDAVGIEAGDAPLAAIQGYLDGLVFSSPSVHYEIAAIPLDCRDSTNLTREEVLHYYARIIRYGQLDIRCGHRCIRLEPGPDTVRVVAATAGGEKVFEAEKVIFTAWYRKRPVPPGYLAAGCTIPVYRAIKNPLELVNRRVVIFGGGISGFELACVLMMQGQAVTLLMRRSRREEHESEPFRRLVGLTRSVVYEHVTGFRAEGDAVSFEAGGNLCRIGCDALFFAIGSELSPPALAMLQRAGVLSDALVRQLERYEKHHPYGKKYPSLEEKAAALREKPDLYEHLVAGKHGVHLAGGPLHLGEAGAGVAVSIRTAMLAVDAICGKPLPEAIRPPLATALKHWNLSATARRNFDLIAPLRPLAVGAWTRNWLPLDFSGSPGYAEDHQGDHTVARPVSAPDAFLLRGMWNEENACNCIALSDGTLSLGELAEQAGCTTEADKETLLRSFEALWQHNALTWLPPADGLPPGGNVPDRAAQPQYAAALTGFP